MSLQWALVATFLYVEIAVIILLLLPLIPARAWQKLFKSRFLSSLGKQANLWFTGFLLILVLMFVDSIREMRKYSVGREEHGLDHGHLDAELQYSMKLFRAQRNFYIAGFALFLCLVIRRLVLLIQTQAGLQAERDAALSQAKGATAAAQSLLDTGDKQKAKHENIGNEEIEKKSKEVKALQTEVKALKDELIKAKTNEEAIKKQAASVSKEYDRLMKETAALQQKAETTADTRKDR